MGYVVRIMEKRIYSSRSGKPGSRRAKITILTLIILFSLALGAAASPFDVTAQAADLEGRPVLRLDFVIPPDHNLYSSFSVATPAGADLEAVQVPEPDTFKPDDFEPSYSTSFSAYYDLPAGHSVVVAYQGCKGELCYLPEEITLEIGAALPHAAQETPPPPPSTADSALADWPEQLAARGEPARLVGYADADSFLAFLDPSIAPDHAAQTPSAWRLFIEDPAQFYLRRGLLPVLLLILVGGLLLNLTPCVLPMIPINLAIIGASGADTPRATRFALGLVYGLGMALVYGILGLVVVLTGSVFGAINSSPAFTLSIAVLFFVLALAMFDIWQLDFSRFRKTSALGSRGRLPAVLILGGISALLAGACVAPVLIAVLALSGSLYAQGVAAALALPFLLGVGMALPWPLAAAGLAVLPKPGAWMEHVKKAFGVLILLLALYYAWTTWRLLRAAPSGDIPPVAAETGSPFQTVDLARTTAEDFGRLVGDALATGRPVLFDFGANWCKSCKLMQATTLQEARVLEKLGGLEAIHVIADAPNKSPARDLLAPFAIQGYPTYLLYPG